MKYYTGIGSRSTPDDIQRLMKVFAAQNADRGWTLRSGAAPGADTAFESGISESLAYYAPYEPGPAKLAQIYLPWPSFENRAVGSDGRIHTYAQPAFWTYDIAAEHHPAWERLSQGAQKLHARNVHQVLGSWEREGLSKFVLCWTPDGNGGGGTGQAIRIAKAYGVPVFDLADENIRRRVEDSLAA